MPTDQGNQIVTLKFADPRNTSNVNKRQKDVVPTGIYKGGYLTKISDSSVSVSPLVCEIQSGTTPFDQVRIETTAAVTVTGVDTSKPYIVLRWTYTGSAANDYMDFGSGLTAVATPDAYDLVVGKADKPGATLLGFDYGSSLIAYPRSTPSIKDLFLKVEPLEVPSLYVRVRAGFVQIGNSRVKIADQEVGPFSNAATKTGAIYISDTGVITVSSDFTYTGQLVLAEIAITSGMGSITSNKITDVRPFLTNPIIPDLTTITRSTTGKIQVVRSLMTPKWTVQVADATNYTTPAQFVSTLATFSIPSFGSVMWEDAGMHYFDANNSILCFMTVNSVGAQTKYLRLFSVDDSVYIYVGGVLAYSRVGVYHSTTTPLLVTLNLANGNNLIQIVSNDSGGEDRSLCLVGDIVDGTLVTFVS